MLLEKLFNIEMQSVEENVKNFKDDYPLAAYALIGMGAVIFAQRIEIGCQRVVKSAPTHVLIIRA